MPFFSHNGARFCSNSAGHARTHFYEEERALLFALAPAFACRRPGRRCRHREREEENEGVVVVVAAVVVAVAVVANQTVGLRGGGDRCVHAPSAYAEGSPAVNEEEEEEEEEAAAVIVIVTCVCVCVCACFPPHTPYLHALKSV